MLGLPFKAAGSVEGLGSLANPFVRYCKNMENMTIVMTVKVYSRFEFQVGGHSTNTWTNFDTILI